MAGDPRAHALRLALAILAWGPFPQPAESAGQATIATIGEIRFLGAEPGARTIYSEQALRRSLAGEVGRACEPARIEEAIASRYRALGYLPLVSVACDGGDLRLSVRESSHRIALITFDPSDLGRIGLAAAANEDEKTFYPVPLSAPRDLILGLLQTRVGDLYNLERYRLDRAALDRLGYALLFIPGAPAEEEEYRDGAYLIQSARPRPEDASRKPHKVNYLGGNAGYGPRTGASAGVTYRRSDIWQALDSLTVTPTFNSEWGGDITYAAPLLAARQAPRRLYDIRLSAFTTFQNNRLIEGVEQDERRTGFAVALGARPLRLRGPNDLRLEGEVRRESIDLGGDTTAPDLTLLRLSAAHDWRHIFRPPSLAIRTVPSLEWSLATSGGLPYVRPAIQMYLHSRQKTGFEIDLHLSGGGLDRPVPEYELFSLGGPTTVRGFQSDTRLGRGIAALQSELWIPFARPLAARPIGPEEATNPDAVPRVPRFIDAIKGAVFVDGGAVWQSPGIGRDALMGAGVGIRLVVPGQPLVVRLDYAWGLGTAGGDAYPYVSIGYAF